MKNKLIYIILFIILFSFILTSNCFAALDLTVLPQGLQDCINTNANGTTADEAFQEANYYIIFQDDSYNTILYFSKSEISCFDTGDVNVNANRYYIGTSEGSDNLFAITFNSNDGSNYNWAGSGDTLAGKNTYISSASYNIIRSNFNVYDSQSGELLFQQPPQVGTLAPIVEEVETEKTLTEVIAILPLIIVVVVSFLGLRKALKMLSMLLRRS